MKVLIEVEIDPIAMIVDTIGFPSFTSKLGVMCRVLKKGKECNMELTKEQCITGGLVTEEAFEASLEGFINAVLLARPTAQSTTSHVEIPVPTTAQVTPLPFVPCSSTPLKASTGNDPFQAHDLQPTGNVLSSQSLRRPFGELNQNSSIRGEGVNKVSTVTSPPNAHDFPYSGDFLNDPDYVSLEEWRRQLQMMKLCAAKPTEQVYINMAKSKDPYVPSVWVNECVIDAEKDVLSYKMNDGTIGAIFKDLTKLFLLVDQQAYLYVEREGTEHYYAMKETYPPTLEEKVKLLDNFRSNVSEKMMKAGAAFPSRVGDEKKRLTFVHQWFHTSRAVVMHLTNGALQANFHDHVKLILSPASRAVTVLTRSQSSRSFRLASLAEFGCSVDLLQLLDYVSEEINVHLAS